MLSSSVLTLAGREPHVRGLHVFATPLGWMALVMRANVLHRLTFGHRSAKAAAAAIGLDAVTDSDDGDETAAIELADRLTQYAEGAYDDFLDIAVDVAALSPFALSIIETVRRIPYGQTRSYGQISAIVGRPRAARAVGRVMAQNRTPLVVPCHRVVASGGGLCGFSAVDGLRMKRRLLELEAG